MSDERKWTFVKFVSIGVGLGSLILAGQSASRLLNKWRITRQARYLQDDLKSRLKVPLPMTTVVSRHLEWETIYQTLFQDISRIPIVGFDCEWVNFNGKTKPVAMIQLASYRGVCALVRVCCMSTIPPTLRDILSDPGIFKVGVATWEDAIKLKKDMNIHVQGVYDIRHLIPKHPQSEELGKKSGLSGLSEKLMDQALNKKFSVRVSDWEAEILTEEQMKYASQDAIASIGICLKMVADTEPSNSLLWQSESIEHFFSTWTKHSLHVDTKFRMPKGFIRNTSPFTKTSSVVSQPKSNSSSSRAYATRKTALYNNCILEAPDGQQLCTCDTKKALWYVEKERGTITCENPLTVRLNFEPAGRPSSEYDQYYLLDKANKCVVCGQENSMLRKNIVPHDYRRHFPTFLKDHKSHDILLLCLDCHSECCVHDNRLRNQLAVECSAPVGTEKDVKTKLDKGLNAVQRASNALLTSRQVMPASRVSELEDVIKTYYQVDVVTPEVLQMGSNLQIRIPNADYIPHGLKVVRHYQERENLLALERRWREHFVNAMNPKHLPSLWSVEHNRKPEEKWKGKHQYEHAAAVNEIKSQITTIQ